MKIKICGMKYSKNILEASQLHPDFLGFIFWKKSPRYFQGVLPRLPDTIKKVGVFVDASLDEMLSRIRQYDLDLVQLHGNETVATCQSLKALNIPVIKVFSVGAAFSLASLEPFEAVCDYFLLDTKGKMPGGNGTIFDWQILKDYRSAKPLFLSGGIGIEEISILQQLDLPVYAIDINSKFETEPGLKNIALLKEVLPLKNKR